MDMSPCRNILNAFVINMPSDTERLNRTLNQFVNIPQIKIHRFIGNNGDKILKTPYFNNKIWNIARYFSPKKTIGIAGTHILLANSLLENDFYDKHRWALILEDDVRVEYPHILLDSIQEIMNKHPDADIIKLHCIFNCPRTSQGILSGSAAAYLLSFSGAKKLSETHITFPGHIDFVMNSKRFNTKNYNVIKTYDEPTPLKINEINDPGFWLNQPYIRLFDKNITGFNMITWFLIVLLLCFNNLFSRKIYIKAVIFFLTFFATNSVYNCKYTMHYNSSNVTHMICLIFPIIILLLTPKCITLNNKYLTYPSEMILVAIFFFHIFYEEDRRLTILSKNNN